MISGRQPTRRVESKQVMDGKLRKFVLLLVVLAAAAWIAREGHCADKGYAIGNGDILSIKIFAGGVTQETVDVTVSSRGTVNVPFLGEIRAAGLSVAQLTDAITRPLEQDYFVNPQVIINIKDYKSKKVYITGAVEKPGLYALEGSTTLLEMIAKAGGVTKERGNTAFILKGSIKDVKDDKELDRLVKDRKAVQVSLRELLDQGVSQGDVELEADDVVYIQQAGFSNVTQHKVSVLGKVEKPGVYDFQEGLTALDACTMAGGFSKYAAPNRTVITRRNGDEQRTIDINLEKVQTGQAKDVPLQPGDRVFVPESWF